MSGLGASGLYSAAQPGARVFGNRVLPVNRLRIAASQTRLRKFSRQMATTQSTAAVENPVAVDNHTNGTGNYYQRVYTNLKIGDSLDKDYSNDTAASPKDRRAGNNSSSSAALLM